MKLHIPTYTPPSIRATIPSYRREVEKIEVQKIATRIRKLRQQKQLTQQELAERCRFPGPWKISRLEGGKKGSGIERLDTLEIVCQKLGIELWELLKPDWDVAGEEEVTK